eukprot:CCRYP_012021-RA/>CCRYP_012021-RA protein AED:0.02 eAED:0.02 QI:94/1/1/1/0.87/0.88/9/625/3358
MPQSPPPESQGNLPAKIIMQNRPTSHSKKHEVKASLPDVPNLLLKLLEACAKHKRHHEHDDEHDEESAGYLKKCQHDLQSLSRVLPRMEQTIAAVDRRWDEYCLVICTASEMNDKPKTSARVAEITKEDDIRHLCALYRAIARGAFCPHAANFLFGGRDFTAKETNTSDVAIPRGILPRIIRLMKYLIMDPVREASAHLSMGDRTTSLEEHVKAFYQEEDIGATIASLLNLLQAKKLRISAINDLIDLANDLNAVGDSSVLFEPSLSCKDPDVKDCSGGKIRVSVFTELIGHFDEESNDDIMEAELHISSRRSLLSLQLGVWTVLYHLFPLYILDADTLKYCGKCSINTRKHIDKAGLLNSLLAAARPILQISSRGNLKENQIGAWIYSEDDIKIHSLLFLRTKLVISGLLRCIITSDSSSKLSKGVRGDLSTVLFGGVFQNSSAFELVLLSVETVKSHAVWNHSHNADNFDFTTDDIEEQLNTMYSWSVSTMVISTIVFPDNDPSATDLWVHAFPYLVDCIPFIVDRQYRLKDHQKCVTRVVLRVLHVLLLRHREAATLFINKCMAQGYFPYLFELACDSLESVSGPAVAIIGYLLDPSFHQVGEINKYFNGETYWDAPTAPAARLQSDCDIGNANVDDQSRSSAHLGRKRRRLLHDSPRNSLRTEVQGASIYAALFLFVKDGVRKADELISAVDGRLKLHSTSEGPKVISLITAEDLPKLYSVSGLIRILMSLRSAISSLSAVSTVEIAIGRLFLCLQNVCNILSSHEKAGGICHIEASILRRSLSLIACVGHHAYRVEKMPMKSSYYSERESITHCVMTSLPLIDANDVVELDDDSAFDLWTKPGSSAYCKKVCSHLCSVLGSKYVSSSDVCLCRLIRDTSNPRISRECGAFLLDDVVPLSGRCILLAALFPITADSNHNDTTLTSIQRILVDSSRSSHAHAASLVSLPTLFLSLASTKQHPSACSRYLLSLMNSFDFKIVARHCQSSFKMVQVSAFLALARLNHMYAATSMVVSNQDLADRLSLAASSFLWKTLNPLISGIDSVLLSLFSLNEFSSFCWMKGNGLPPSLAALVDLNDKVLPLLFGSPHVLLAAHKYLQSTLAVVSRSTLLSFGAYEFVLDKSRYSYFDAVAEGGKECHPTALASIPAPLWILLVPFISATPISSLAAKSVGPTLLRNHSELFSALFVSDDEMEAGPLTKETAFNAVERCFRVIDYLAIKFCQLPSALLLFSEEDNSKDGEEPLNNQGLETVVCLFKSLCRSSSLDSAIGFELFQQSILRLLRIWIGGTNARYRFFNDNKASGSAFSAAYDAIKEIFDEIRQPAQSHQFLRLMKCRDFVASIFREYFLVKDSTPFLRYRLLVTFIESCLLPYTRTHGLPARGLDVPNNVGVVGFIDDVYPSVITSMIFNEDIEGLEMCAAFRMYLISEHKKQSKEEKRAQKKNTHEFIVGAAVKKDRPATFSRDLVPGVTIAGSSISTKKLTENMKLLCWKSDVIEYILPRLLLHSDRSVLKFFADLCPPDVSFSEILQRKEQTVLKTLVWELGAVDYNNKLADKVSTWNDIVLALKMGYLIKEGHYLMSASEKSADAADDASARNWIGPNFMYLLVNIVLHKWSTRTEQEKIQTIKCLKAMLHFLSPCDSLQYMPQIMVAISNAMGSVETSIGMEDVKNLRFIAVATLFDFVKILAAHNIDNVGEHLTSIVVLLFPLFESKEPPQRDIARDEAVKLLVYLAGNVSAHFTDIPFLPVTSDLQEVRDLLASNGIHIEDVRLISQQTVDHGNTSDADPQPQSKFYAQMNVLSELIATHENKQVRKVVIVHMTRLLEANRDLFRNMIENEGLASMHFLTVVHNERVSAQESINSGFVTKLIMRLLSRCVDESDCDIRDALARCLGEIGAIDPNRLGKEIGSSQFNSKLMENDDSDDWRLTQPPWKSNVTRYELRLVTRHLVWGLKSATTTLDQHKIAFAIQELLKQIDANFVASKSNGNETSATLNEKNSEHSIGTPMSSWLKEKLEEADVRCIVEPFWTSTYQQQEISVTKKPPFFTKSNSYFSWLSSFCRFMVTRSYSNEKSIWRNLFHACRSAVRSQAGIGVAEFILPVMILDAICFGDQYDEDVVTSEILAALSFDNSTFTSSMDLREREKAVNALFVVLDVIRYWMETEMEQMCPSPVSRSKRGSRQSRNGDRALDSWPVEESISKISQFLKSISSSACAIAASSVGMNALALRFLEIESRGKCGLQHPKEDSHYTGKGPKHLRSQFIDGIDLELTQMLLGKLNDFDTMVVITQKGHHRQSSLTRRLAEEAFERELYGDVEGSCQAYEQLLDTRLNREVETQPSFVDCTRLGAQKGLLRSLLKLGRLDSVINQAYGMSSNLHSDREKLLGISDEFLPSAAEAAWRLGKWSVLDELSEVDIESFSNPSGRHQLSFGRVMHSLNCRSSSKFLSSLQEAREYIMTSLSSAARDSYCQSYPYLMQLHALREVERASSGFFGNATNCELTCDEWRQRLSLTSPDSTGSNIIVNARLALSRMSNEPISEGMVWLDIGKLARKGGLFQVAEQCLTHADVSFCASLDTTGPISRMAREAIGKVKLQFAKLKYALGETTTALNLVEDDVPSSVFHLDGEQLHSFVSNSELSVDVIGRLVLQATGWMVSDGLKSGSEIRSRYQTVLKLVPNWERAHFYFGKYLDMLHESFIAKCIGQSWHGVDTNANRANAIGSNEQCQRLLIDSVNHYGVALQLGQKHVYQALPRLLAMWLEFTAITESKQSNGEDGARNIGENQSEVNNLVKSFIPKIPEHLFYTALPQLVSCILHNNEDSSRNVIHILTSVLSKYPCEAMWACNWLRFSKSEEKQKAGEEIFHGAKKALLKIEEGKQMQGMLDASKKLFEFLIQLAKFSPKNSATSVKMKPPTFAVALTNFIPPIQAALSVTPGALDRADVKDVFPPFVPRMRAFNPEVKIMQSKAKPKKLSVFAVPSTVARRGSLPDQDRAVEDAGEMHFLVKQEAKGDLRKDSRVQDLNNVINRLFVGRKSSSGSDSRRQRLRLHLRTFSVVCLAEDCGILEWVPNTDSFRSLVGGTYNPQVPPNSIHRRGARITNYNNLELRDTFLKCQDLYFKKGKLTLAAKKFDELVLQQYLPIMYWWFIQNFSNPHAWFEARNNFTLSAAVWSAVGHIIGLGDRHSENILIDTRSGECVHVDFDCIFDKGLLLPRPEVIPFRLTPNMIDAFGPTGSDGLYTGALIESMKTLRHNRDTLLSVLEPFLKDPVINFQSSKNQQKSQGGSAKAVESMRKIDGRLKGMYNLENPNLKKVTRQDGFSQVDHQDDGSHVALSVEGQVQRMILEATSHENLVQVYVGWMPWI